MKLRAIILDDNEKDIKLLELELKGFPVTVEKRFTNPIEFLAEEKNIKYDFLFLDMNMPGVKGNEIIAKIKKPVVLVTGESRDFGEIINDIEIDYRHFVCPINKPVNQKRIAHALEKLHEKIAQKTHLEFNTVEGKKLININDIDVISSQDIDKNSEPQGEAKIIYLKNANPILVNSLNLEDVFFKLNKKMFLKANRYDIINIRCVKTTTHDSIDIEYTSKTGHTKTATRTLGKDGKGQYREML
jgi:CheY-like chemotaxis protein